MDLRQMLPILGVLAMITLPPDRCAGPPVEQGATDQYTQARARMVREQIASRDVTDPRVLEAIGRVPRHLFVPQDEVRYAYEDRPLPIGYGQTISQPYIVALMTQLARPAPTDRALEVGTGSGYQAAVLAPLVRRLFTIELEEPLARQAEERLRTLGYANVTVRHGDGYAGWPEEAPFDVILVTAAPEEVPPALVAQLAPGGRMVIPVGPVMEAQDLLRVEKGRDGAIRTEEIIPVRFVPLRHRER